MLETVYSYVFLSSMKQTMCDEKLSITEMKKGREARKHSLREAIYREFILRTENRFWLRYECTVFKVRLFIFSAPVPSVVTSVYKLY